MNADGSDAKEFKEQIPQKQFRYKQEFKAQCIRMRLDGASWDQISRTMNVSPTTVRRWIEESCSILGFG